eukprot:5927346-Lingulodinium_polyedra.AAC.1
MGHGQRRGLQSEQDISRSAVEVGQEGPVEQGGPSGTPSGHAEHQRRQSGPSGAKREPRESQIAAGA